jgi:uncharacterized protein YbbC (DUF1343 family)
MKYTHNFLLLFVSLFLVLSCQSQDRIVKTGIDVLQESGFALLEGKRVGLITNPTGVDRNLRSTIDILFEAPNVELVALYGPEHGVRGEVHAGDRIVSQTDPITGLPEYSLYGSTRRPTEDMLEGLDVLVYDIQDIGSRSFTYISTMVPNILKPKLQYWYSVPGAYVLKEPDTSFSFPFGLITSREKYPPLSLRLEVWDNSML